jgi:hypothetical protein
MCAHGYDNWKQTDPAAAELGPETYPCHYCGDPTTNEELVCSEYDNGLDSIMVCSKPTCQARYAHRINSEGLALVVRKVVR